MQNTFWYDINFHQAQDLLFTLYLVTVQNYGI